MLNYPDIILASSSPRRLDLLNQAGIKIAQIIAPEIDESLLKRELPKDAVQRLSLAKWQAVKHNLGTVDKPILSADTIVAVGRRILGKPETPNQAEQYLRLLSGRRHRVMTAIVIGLDESKLRRRVVTSIVRFKRLSPAEISSYCDSDEWVGKAGGYALQGQGCAFVNFMSGSYSNVVGLPLFETCQILRSL